MSQVKTAKGFWPGFNQRKFLDDWVMLLAALSIFVLSALFIDNFLSPLNMRGLGLAISTVGIAACTMLFCLASGHFDLSVGSVIACAGVVAGIVIRDTDSVVLGVSAALAMGLVVGLINGIVIAKLRINALIATLATMQIVRGLAYIFSNGKAVGVMDERFFVFGNGQLMGVPVPINPILAMIKILFLLGAWAWRGLLNTGDPMWEWRCDDSTCSRMQSDIQH